MGLPPRRWIVFGLISTYVLSLLLVTHYSKAPESSLATRVGSKMQDLLYPDSPVPSKRPDIPASVLASGKFHDGTSDKDLASGKHDHGPSDKDLASGKHDHGTPDVDLASGKQDHGTADKGLASAKHDYDTPDKGLAPGKHDHGTPDKDKEQEKPEKQEEPKESEQAEEASSYDPGTEKGLEEIGKHFHVRPSAPTPKSVAIEGCKYPILIHVTPDKHCTGALALYASIVRNVLMQPKAMANKTCVHVTYVDPELHSIEKMYQWPAQPNPFTSPADCAALDSIPALNKVVPIRFQALRDIEVPQFMDSQTAWTIALNKIHSWAFDAYPRILLMDADSVALTDLHLIFDEANPWMTIAGAPDQYEDCADRVRINGGMILLRASRYFHMSALEAIYDPRSSCSSHQWTHSEQELLNCLCGFQGRPKGIMPEFQCALMPLYNSVWPKNYACSAANVLPIRSVHYTAVMKPWVANETQLHSRFDYAFWACLRDAGRANNTKALVKCNFPDPEVSRLLDTPDSFEAVEE